MNYDVFEHYLVGYCLSRPKYIKKLDMNIIQRSTFREILEIGKELAGDNEQPVSGMAIKAKIQNGKYHVLPMEVDIVYDLIGKELIHKSNTEIKDEINNIINFLTTRNRRNTVVDTLKTAIRRVEEGKEAEGILMAKTIKFNDAQPLRSTADLMLDSVEETNIFPTGIEAFDRKIGGLAKGNMMSIAGDTGSMKTMISIWLCLQILKSNPKFICLYFEKEMPVKDVARRIAANASSISVSELMDPTKKLQNRDSLYSMIQSNEETADLMNRFKIVPSGNFSNVSDMYRYIDTYQADIWCLDFLTQLGAEDTSQDFNRFTMAQASMLKNIISETDSFGIVLNQIKKNSVRQRKNKIPILDDIEWSGAISQYSAYIFSSFFPSVYYGDAPNDYFYLYGLKNRHHRPVNINLMATPEYCQFTEPAKLQSPLMENWLSGYLTKSQDNGTVRKW